MNQKMINSVKQELLQNIKCQYCWSFYENKNINIKSLWWNKGFITAKCEKCWVFSEFQADIKKQENKEIKGEKYENKIKDWNLKILEKWNNIIKNKKNKDISFSVIKEEEVWNLMSLMSEFSSFKNFFSIVLVCSFIFTWCADTAEENRQNILNSINSAKIQIETTKNQAKEFYKDWKEKFDQAKELIETAPEKIEKAKADIEKITNNAVKLKEDLEKKVKDTKTAIDETKKAVDAVSDAMDSINAIWWNISWTWENK